MKLKIAKRRSVYVPIGLVIIGLSLYFITQKVINESRNYEKYFETMRVEKSEGKIAPDFVLPDQNGREVSLSNFRGKVVLVKFFRSGCGSCVEEAPSVVKLYDKFKEKGVVVLGVGVGEDNEQVRNFRRRFDITYPTLIDKDRKVSRLYEIKWVPTSFLVSPDGRLTGKCVGVRDWGSDTAYKLMGALLKSSL